MTIAVPERVKVVMQMLTYAAEHKRPCPSNNDIAEKLDAESSSAGTNAIALLESMNLIKVYRANSSRVVEIVATGKRTAGIIGEPHWRARRKKGTWTDSRSAPIKSTMNPERRSHNTWASNDDALLMERIAEGDDFEQAGYLIGKPAGICATRFDYLAAQMGSQAC